MPDKRDYPWFCVLTAKNPHCPYNPLARIGVRPARQQTVDPHTQGRMYHHAVSHINTDMGYTAGPLSVGRSSEKYQIPGLEIAFYVIAVQRNPRIYLLTSVRS